MPKEIAISIHDLTKKYRLFSTPAERLKESLHPLRKRYHREFWALKGISLEIRKGEIVGILGKNGSGKSTLLQIVASILQPTSGMISVNGRVSAILELGTGFNPEFTGRQNVMLNGAIMGVPRNVMIKRVPEIIAFADIGEFFDQPMKLYSTGMFVRVAFAASIHSDPDILIVDEALAVGDAKFQYRCFQKLKEFHDRGSTIVLVTHAPELVVRHCGRAILLDQGRVLGDGAPEAIVRQYIDLLEEREPLPSFEDARPLPAETEGSVAQSVSAGGGRESLDSFLADVPNYDQCNRRATYNASEHPQQDPRAAIVDYLVICDGKVDPTQIESGEEIDIYFKVRFHADINRPCFGIAVNSKDGILIYALNSAWTNSEPIPARAGDCRVVRFRLVLGLNSGDVFFDFGVDELRDETSYTNVCRRMGLVHVVIHCNKMFHGLTDFHATFWEHAIDGRAGAKLHE